jgi:Zn-dependent protease
LDRFFEHIRKRNIDALKNVRNKRHLTRNSSVPCTSSGEYMKELSCLLIGTLVLLLLLSVPVFAGDVLVPAGDVPDPSIRSLSINPETTTAPPSVIINPRVVVRTTVPPQATGVLFLESVPPNALVYIDGILKGSTPLTIRATATGVHEVSFRLAGFQNYTTKVTVTTGAVTTSSVTLSPIITQTITRTVSPAVSGTIPVTTPQGTVTINPSATTVSPAVTQVIRRTSGTPAVTCTRHYSGSGETGAAQDGRLNCTVIISSDDQIATLSVQEGTLVTDAGKNPVLEIHISPVIPAEILSGAGPDGHWWVGRAYDFLPDQTSFDPPVLVSFKLGLDEWERSDPSDLTIWETNGTGPGWERLQTRIDPLTRTISAPVRHFSIIGLFSTSPAGNPPENPQSSLGLIGTATGSNKATLPLSAFIPDKVAPLAAVVAGITISILGTMASGSSAVARVWDRIIELFKKFLGTETVGLMNVTEIEKRGIRPAENLPALLLGLSSHEILVITLSAFGFAAAFLLQDQLELKLTTVIIFVCAGGIATILHDLAHKYAAYRCGCITEYQFWTLGTVTMLSTAWLFGNAFAKPSRTLIRSDKPLLAEEAARIRLAGPLMSTGLAIVSLFLIPLGGLFIVAGSAGFSMNLLNSVFSLVPVKPNDGVEVYAWNKLIWAGVFIPLIAFYLYIYLAT